MATITRTKADSGKQAGEASRIAVIAGPGSGRLTTGVRTAEGDLRLIEWEVREDSVQRIPDVEGRFGPNVSDVEIASRSGAFLTTALRVSGDLKVVSWDSGLQPLGNSGNQAGEATQVAACRLDVIAEPPQRIGGLATAVRDSDGDLKVIAWRVSNDGRSIDRVADSRQQAGEAKEVSITGGERVDGVNIVTTAVKTNENRLKLISWAVPASESEGELIRRRGESIDIDNIDDVVAVGRERVVTAVRTDKGNLQLIAWQVAPDGSTVRRLGDSGDDAGRASKIALARFGSNHYVTALRTREGNLRLIAWEVPESGQPRRVGDSGDQAGQVSEVSLAQVGDGLFFTAVRDSDGRLRVIGWRVEL